MRIAIILAALTLASPLHAASSKITCTLTESCTADGKCTAAPKPRVISFCPEGGQIEVAAKGGRITEMTRLRTEDAYSALSYKAFKGQRLDVGQWADPDVAAGNRSLITFIMLETSQPKAMLFEGDPLSDTRLGYLFGSCVQSKPARCEANK